MPNNKNPHNTQPAQGSTRLDPGGMKKAFKTPDHTKVDEEEKDKDLSFGAKITRGLKRRLGK